MIWRQLLDRGYTVIPLVPGTKRPLVKWKRFQTIPPSLYETIEWFQRWPGADLSVLTSEHSGILCLDCDQPPYPDSPYFTPTPRGGRHYWYPFDESIRHGTNVAPGKDIPWIVKIYAVPAINQERFPLTPKPSRYTQHNASRYERDTTVPVKAYRTCSFMRWYQRNRFRPLEGRYPLARAYASNIVNSTPDNSSELVLGNNYRHEQHIYDSITKPITCQFIVNSGFPCPHYDKQQTTCKRAQCVRSPYGLANEMRKQTYE